VVASLRSFFEPRSVAIIGASPRRGTIGGELFRNVLAAGFAGPAYPVNRRGDPVAGIPGLVTHESNGLLVDRPSAEAVADAMARVINDPRLRQRLIASGYATARTCTLETQAAGMMATVSSGLHVALRQPLGLPVG
jgi:hypothetical protein